MASERPRREPEGMTDQRPDTHHHRRRDPTPTRGGSNGLLLDPDAARREERHGWLMLTGIFVAGGVLVVLAALVT